MVADLHGLLEGLRHELHRQIWLAADGNIHVCGFLGEAGRTDADAVFSGRKPIDARFAAGVSRMLLAVK